MTKFIWVAVALVLSAAPAAYADEAAIKLAPGEAREMVETRCVACHSLDYIKINSRFMNQATWDAEVQKMVKKFGAPLDTSETKAIIDYLTKNYGI
jgi:cytochrome c5